MRALLHFAMLLRSLPAFLRSRTEQALVELALRQQLATYAEKGPRLTGVNYRCRRVDSPELLLARGRCLIGIVTRKGDNRREATMGTRIDLRARRALVRAVSERYRQASARDKRRILDQFSAITGYHRKHSIRLLNSTAERVAPRQGARFRVYDEAVKQAVIVLWEASDRICGKRLKALLPVLVPALERHGHLCLDEAVREKLLAASAATLDREDLRRGQSSDTKRSLAIGFELGHPESQRREALIACNILNRMAALDPPDSFSIGSG